jgi:uncharacterized Ntn-hydrolase superfamily protein
MTFSLVARDPLTGDLGVATASKFLAVGSVVPWARWDAGAIATQSLGNVAYGPDAFELLWADLTAGDVVERLIAADELREFRQVGVVDRHGAAATYTGTSCMTWAGGRTGPGAAAQGNLLVGPEVVDALLETYLTADGPVADRLLAGLAAGDAAGGDRRGRQSAALLVVRERGGYLGANDRWLDLRVDDHPDPVAELRRLRGLHRLLWERAEPEELIPLDDRLAAELRDLLDVVAAAQRSQDDGDLLATVVGSDEAPAVAARPYPTGWDDQWQERLLGWMGVENLEMRMAPPGWIDPGVLGHLRGAIDRR